MSARPLPAAFVDLAKHVEEWALPNEKARYHKLHTVPIERLRSFYQAMLPRLPAVLEYLNQYSADALPEDAATLFDLAMTFAETAHPVDLNWGDVDFKDAYAWDKLEFLTVSSATRSPKAA